MKRTLIATVFMVAVVAWAAQQPSTSQQQPTAPGSADQNAPQAGGPGQMANAPITEGCLGGSNPNFTITDNAGTTYKLILPPNADASSLNPHVGESVQVLGDVRQTGGTNSIDVSKIGKGTGKCPANSPTGNQQQPKP